MKPIATINNNIFVSAFLGVVLLIAAVGFTLADFSNIAMFKLSSAIILGTLSFSSFSLLFKAIKHDKRRFEEANAGNAA